MRLQHSRLATVVQEQGIVLHIDDIELGGNQVDDLACQYFLACFQLNVLCVADTRQVNLNFNVVPRWPVHLHEI